MTVKKTPKLTLTLILSTEGNKCELKREAQEDYREAEEWEERVGKDCVGGRSSPLLSLQHAFLPHSLSLLFSFFLQLENGLYTWGVIVTTAFRGSADAEPKQKYPRSSHHSPPSHCRQTRSLRLCV